MSIGNARPCLPRPTREKVFIGQVKFSCTKEILSTRSQEVEVLDAVEDMFLVRRGSLHEIRTGMAFVTFVTPEAANALISMSGVRWPEVSLFPIPMSFAKVQPLSKRKTKPATMSEQPSKRTKVEPTIDQPTPAPVRSSSSTASGPKPPASPPPASLIAAHVLKRGEELIAPIRAEQLADLHEEMTTGISMTNVLAEAIGGSR